MEGKSTSDYWWLLVIKGDFGIAHFCQPPKTKNQTLTPAL
jgi:hypothetical protein